MSDPFYGEIKLLGFNFAPRGWMFCGGSLLDIASNSTLFSLLGTFYGGDGRSTFGLPDFRARTPISHGRHPGSMFDWRMGQLYGSPGVTLQYNNLAVHSHAASVTLTGGDPLVQIEATQRPGGSIPPVTGAFLAKPHPSEGRGDYQELVYNDDPSLSSLVALGGFNVTTSSHPIAGSAIIGETGGSTDFSVVQPTQALNYSIANTGTYPPRS